jgi:putative ABC transport system ATP-binding protein
MIHIENICKFYGGGEKKVRALDDVSLEINDGEFAVIQGPSGSGKTTLLMALGGMMRPTSGKIIMSEKELYGLSVGERAVFRSQNVGFVFQMFHLLPYLNVLDNVLLASKKTGGKKNTAEALDLLKRLDMTERIYHKPAALSAGEKQRTALARAMINKPSIILADEPTGNLDPENAEMVMGVLKDFNDQGGVVIVVTHGEQANQYATKTVRLNKGRVVA